MNAEEFYLLTQSAKPPLRRIYGADHFFSTFWGLTTVARGAQRLPLLPEGLRAHHYYPRVSGLTTVDKECSAAQG